MDSRSPLLLLLLLPLSLALQACANRVDLDAGIDLGADAGRALSSCEVTCVAIHPGEYRAECQGSGCPTGAYGICDADAAPTDLDGGLLVAPVCARPGVSSEVDRVAACAIDGRGIALLTGQPVVRCGVTD